MEIKGEIDLCPEEIVEEYGGMVSRLCYRMVPDCDIADDTAQEVWYEVLKSLDTYRGEAKVSTWIYKIAYRVIKNYSPNKKLYDEAFLKYCFDGPDFQIPDEIDYDKKIWIKEQCDKCLTGVLQCLKPEKKLAFFFRDGAKLSYQTIAEILNKKEATVRKIVSRSRRKLRNFLNGQCTLYNPDGNCNCRMKKLVEDVNLDEEYKKIRKLIGDVSFYAQSEEVMPTINYWKKYL
ncbi:MAG: RNA polymerase sigma factor [Halothermotrichaceae bacterium]